MSKEFILKKKIFGGFDRRQVVECLASLQTECAEPDNNSDIQMLEERIQDILTRLSEKDEEITTLKSRLDELNKLSESSTQPADTFASLTQADMIINSAKNEAEQYIKATDSYIKSSNKEFSTLMTKISKLRNEIDKMGKSTVLISDSIASIDIDSACCIDKNTQESKPDSFESSAHTSQTEQISYEEDISYEDENADIFLNITENNDIGQTAEAYNSVDNFFSELEKLTGNT